MKTKYTIFIVLMLSVLYSCTDDNIPSTSIDEGSPVVLNLNLAYPESKSLDIATRASLSTNVYDFYLFIFDAEGNLKNKYYFPTTTTATNSDEKYSSNAEAILTPTTEASGKLSNIATTSGNSYILGVANVNLKVGNSILDALNDITTMDGLKKCLAVEPTINPSVFTMSGYYSPDNNVSTEGRVEIPTESNVLTGYIHLIPVDAHITFEVQAGTISGRDFAFSLDSWQVVNVPQNVHLFHTGSESGENFYNSEASVQVTKETPTSGKTKYSFDFFVQERLSNATGIEKYGDRAAWTQDTQNKVDNKKFTNAPSNATYVILKGRYKGESPIQTIGSQAGVTTTEEVDANVTYTIFLGEDSHNDFNSFVTNRNVNYTYKITVNGVKDISVEVRANKEERPDGEGEIILSQGDSYDFDAHYGAIVLEFNQKDIETAINSGRTGYTVVTPYGNKIYVYDAKTSDSEQAPFAEWVKFIRGTNTVNNNHYPKTFNQSNLGENLSKLMSIKDLLNELNTGKVGGADDGASIYSDGIVRYTAYIDEFYYDKEPGTTTTASWKDFVNVDNRKLMILANTELSNDENSSITSAVYVINQKSIKTIYNKDAEGLSRAWGLESIEEPLVTDGRTSLTHGSATIYDYNQSSVYGRKNALYTQEQNSTLTWGNMIANTGYLSNNYNQNIYAACMLRNRDLNGDGLVGADEIRWYVPTLFQYQQMYIGMYGIEDLDARLYYKEAVEENKWEYKHYISSNERQLMWAEEGLSNSTYKPNGAHTGSLNWSGTFTDNLRIRCVRDLGTKINATDKVKNWNDAEHGFQDFYTKKDNNVIELTYLNRPSVRTNLENKEVTGHVTTFSSNNRPALRFQYATTNLDSNNTFDYYDQNTAVDNGGNSACQNLGQGWRLPTLTELNLMRQVGQTFSNNGNTMCRTKFEFYEWHGQNTNMGIPNNSLATSGSGNNRKYYGRYWHMWGTQDQWNPRRFMLTEYSPRGSQNVDGNASNELKAYIRCVKDAAQ